MSPLSYSENHQQAHAFDCNDLLIFISIVLELDNIERPSRFKEVTEEKLSALKRNVYGTA